MVVVLNGLAADFHAAFEYRAILDHNAGGFNIAFHASGCAEDYAVASTQVSFDVPAHDNLARFDIRLDAAVRPNGDTSFAHVNRAN